MKLRSLAAWTNHRRTIASTYSELLQGTDLILPDVPDWAKSAWHLYVVRSPSRDDLQKRLADEGIATLIHYPIPPHMQVAHAGLGLPPGALPIARQLANEVLSLPIGPHLPVEVARVIAESIRSRC